MYLGKTQSFDCIVYKSYCRSDFYITNSIFFLLNCAALRRLWGINIIRNLLGIQVRLVLNLFSQWPQTRPLSVSPPPSWLRENCPWMEPPWSQWWSASFQNPLRRACYVITYSGPLITSTWLMPASVSLNTETWEKMQL